MDPLSHTGDGLESIGRFGLFELRDLAIADRFIFGIEQQGIDNSLSTQGGFEGRFDVIGKLSQERSRIVQVGRIGGADLSDESIGIDVNCGGR